MEQLNIGGVVNGLSTSEWTQIVSAIGTMIAAIVAVIAAIASYRSAKQNNETNEQMVRPRVVVYIESDISSIQIINLIVRNDGGGLARNINLDLDGDDIAVEKWVSKNELLSGHVIFKSGIEVLPSHSENKYSLLSLIGQYDQLLSKHSLIKIEYTDSTSKKSYSESYSLDFASLPNGKWSNADTKAPAAIANELKNIRRILEKK